jgi:hypothetical protein
MMKVTVTHLKAPWPRGSRLGDVVEVGASLPGCFAGKCLVATPGAEADHIYVPPVVVQGGGGSGPPTLPSAAHEVAELRTQLAAAQEEVAALRAMLAGGGGSGPPTLPSAAPEAHAKKK